MKTSWWFLVVFLKSDLLASSDGFTLSSFHLVNGSSPNEGRVEVIVRDDDGDELRGIVISDDSWTIDAANFVCNELGYHHAAFVPDDKRFGRGPLSQTFSLDNGTLVAPECDSEESNSCEEFQSTGVICQKPGYLGCFRIRRSELSQLTILETNQIRTNDECLVLCRNQTASYAAQRDDMCYCLNNFSTSFLERRCDTRCSGNPEQFCGRNQKDSYIVFNVSLGFCPEISGVDLNVYGRYRFGDIVRANCSGGQRLMGDDVLQCLGGPDVFNWNGIVPSCEADYTVQPKSTRDPTTELASRTVTVTAKETPTDATIMTSMGGVGMPRNSSSKSTPVHVIVPVVAVVVIAVLAVLLVLYIIKERKKRPEVKKDESSSIYFSDVNNRMQNTTNDEEPSYYEVGQSAVDGCSNGLLDNVSYKPADNVRRQTNHYELDEDTVEHTPHGELVDNVLYKPADNVRIQTNHYELYEDTVEHTPHGELVDNVLYKPADEVQRHTNHHELDEDILKQTPHCERTDNVLYEPIESTGNPFSKTDEVGSGSPHDSPRGNHISNKFRQLPKVNELTSNESEYVASPDKHDKHECNDEHQEIELIDNILYKPADSQTLQTTSASGQYYEIKSDVDTGHYEEADCPAPDTGPKYYVLNPQAQPSCPSPRTNVDHHETNVEKHDTAKVTIAQDQRNDEKTEITSSSIPGYATVVKGSA